MVTQITLFEVYFTTQNSTNVTALTWVTPCDYILTPCRGCVKLQSKASSKVVKSDPKAVKWPKSDLLLINHQGDLVQ